MNRRYRKTIIAGNWKMNKTATEAKKFVEELKAIAAQAPSGATWSCASPPCNIPAAVKAVQGRCGSPWALQNVLL